MNTLLRAIDVCVSHRGNAVLNGVNLHVNSGEILVLTGPNGSGKSTLLRALCGLTVFQGQIIPEGLSPQERARFIAYMAQHDERRIPFTVEETIGMGRAPWQDHTGHPTELDRSLIQEALELVRVGHLAVRPFMELSGGEQQRVLLARTLCQNSKVLLLDEPTSALDYANQQHIMDSLRCWCTRKGTGMVVVLHDLNLASMYADRVLLLRAGHVKGEGPPKTLFSRVLLESVYDCKLMVDKHPWTQTPRINLCPCTTTRVPDSMDR